MPNKDIAIKATPELLEALASLQQEGQTISSVATELLYDATEAKTETAITRPRRWGGKRKGAGRKKEE